MYDVPPDMAGSIAPNGAAVPVALATPGQNARLSFDGAQGQVVRLNLAGGTFTNCGLRASLLAPDGGTLASNQCVEAGGYLSATSLPVTGAYTVLLDPQGAATGSVSATLARGEVGGTIAANGVATTVTIATPGQTAWLPFAGAAGQRVSLNITGNSMTIGCCGGVWVSVLRPDGTTLASREVGPSGALGATLPVDGAYTVVVDPIGALTGSLTLTLANTGEIGGTIAPGGAPVTITTTAPEQNARLAFSGTQGQRVSLNITAVTIPTSTVALLKPDGGTLASTAVTPSGGFIDTQTLPASGTYAVFVNTDGPGTGSMTLTLHTVPTDTTGTIAAGGTAVTVSAGTPGQNARLTFSGSTSQRVSVNLTSSTIATSTVALLKPDGSTLASVSGVGTGGGFLDTTVLPAAGTYTILVDPQGAATGSMAVQLYTVPADVTGTLRAGGKQRLTIATPGQNARVTFSGTAGQPVTVTLSGVTLASSVVAILKPDGTTLASTTVGTSGGSLTVTPPTSGTYTILVDPQGAATGTITVELSR